MTDDAPPHIDALRHGEVEGGPRFRGPTDDPLSENGWTQMWAATDYHHWDSVVTSPSIRCAHFARTFAERRALPLKVDERLCEMDFGSWEGRTAAELMETESATLARFWRDPWNYPPPGAEPLPQMQQRVLAAWRDIVISGRSTLLVTHGGPIRIFLYHLQNLARENILSIEVPHASLHRLSAFIVEPFMPERLS